jgi:CDP-diacylglycerol--glycerol-3-phosphate 3-phosphatidyltransferase
MTKGKAERMFWTIPNVLTVFRLIVPLAIISVFLILPRPYADMVALGLFLGAAITDYLDGWLARKWNQCSQIGAMLDPIADKALVMITLALFLGLHGVFVWLVIPVAIIIFREVFVSGLRESLGAGNGALKVSRLAKWKTTVQMVAMVVLFGWGIFEHYFVMRSFAMPPDHVNAVLAGQGADPLFLRLIYDGLIWSSYGGLALLWLAAILTIITGYTYFRAVLRSLAGKE